MFECYRKFNRRIGMGTVPLAMLSVSRLSLNIKATALLEGAYYVEVYYDKDTKVLALKPCPEETEDTLCLNYSKGDKNPSCSLNVSGIVKWFDIADMCGRCDVRPDADTGYIFVLPRSATPQDAAELGDAGNADEPEETPDETSLSFKRRGRPKKNE